MPVVDSSASHEAGKRADVVQRTQVSSKSPLEKAQRSCYRESNRSLRLHATATQVRFGGDLSGKRQYRRI